MSAPVRAGEQPRAFASLSSGLLARKGQARPAMRRQDVDTPASAGATDDLGWNDMGDVAAAGSAADPVSAHAVPLPVVLAEAGAHVAGATAPEPLATAAPRTAFTLRLDPERRLRLRLAAAVTRQSAQALLTGALDTLLAAMPAVDALIAEMPDSPAVTRRTRIRAHKITSGKFPQ